MFAEENGDEGHSPNEFMMAVIKTYNFMKSLRLCLARGDVSYRSFAFSTSIRCPARERSGNFAASAHCAAGMSTYICLKRLTL